MEKLTPLEKKLLVEIIIPSIKKTTPNAQGGLDEELGFNILLKKVREFYLDNGGNDIGWIKLLVEITKPNN